MRIGIDARLYGPQHTGIGRYVQNLILNLANVDKKNRYLIFGSPDIAPDLDPFANFKLVKLTTKTYSLAEQITNPYIFTKAKLDLLHVPHFNAPLFYPGKLIITIHDLIKHLSTGKETTTLPSYQYLIKHLGYRVLVRANLIKAAAIITPSNYWKDYLQGVYQVDPQKIHVTYEAVDKNISPPKAVSPQSVLKQYSLKKPFIVYAGNLYPHKNVDFLIQAIKQFNSTHHHQLQLALICARSAFRAKIKPDRNIKLLGFIPDQDLASLYSQALALVQPSLIEGFGLTGLEAMAASLPVISSNTTCLPEVYANAALYFNPYDQNDLIDKIEKIMSDKKLSSDLVDKGKIRVKQFSWHKTAKQTLAVYEKVKVEAQKGHVKVSPTEDILDLAGKFKISKGQSVLDARKTLMP